MKPISSIVVVLLLVTVGICYCQQPQQPQENPQLPLMPPQSPQTNWDEEPTKLSVDEFPIAGFRFYEMKKQEMNLWKEAGLNIFYNDPHQSIKEFNVTPPTVTKDANTIAQEMTKGMKSIIWFLELSSGEKKNRFSRCTDCVPGGANDIAYKASPEYFADQHKIWPDRFGSEASEMRYFLASNFDKLDIDFNRKTTFAYDLMRPWGKTLGAPTDNYEWLIEKDKLMDGTKLPNDVANEPIMSHMDWTDVNNNGAIDDNETRASLVDKQSDKIYCDFIYRIDPLSWSGRITGTNATTELFWVEYYLEYIVGYDGNGNPIYRSHLRDKDAVNDPITYSQYENRDQTYPANEAKDIKSFPNPDFQPKGQAASISSTPYAVKRLVITNMTFDSVVNNVHIGSYPIVGIRCVVKSKHRVDIHVRGVRVRSSLGEQILSGSLDTKIRQLFQNKMTALQNVTNGLTGVTAWDNTFMFAAGGEPTVEAFRVQAYLDDLCNRTIGKHIIPFLSNNLPDYVRPEWYRAVYEEQTGKIPPAISMEDLERFNDPRGSDYGVNPENALVIPADGVDYLLRNDQEFYDHSGELIYLTGFKPNTNPSLEEPPLKKQLDNKLASKKGLYNYDYYTNSIQNRWLDGGTNTPFTFKNCARAINPDWARGNDAGYGKYYAHISMMNSFIDGVYKKDNDGSNVAEGPLSNKASKMSLAEKVFDKMRKRFYSSSAASSIDETPQRFPGDFLDEDDLSREKINFMVDYKDFRSLPKGLDEGRDFPLLRYRPTLRTELRGQAWYSLVYGAQGIVFNTINTDLNANIGWSLNKYVSGSQTHLYKNINHPLDDNISENDRQFDGYYQGGVIGSCDVSNDHPAIDTVDQWSEQDDNDKWADHVIRKVITWTEGTEAKQTQITRTVPFYDDVSSSHKKVVESVNSASTEVSVDAYITSYIADNYYNVEATVLACTTGKSNAHVGEWEFVWNLDACGARRHAVATRKEFLDLANSKYNSKGEWYDDFPKSGGGTETKGGPFYEWSYHYPNEPVWYHSNFVHPHLYIRTFYGFKEKDLGGRRIIKDVQPIAKTLSSIRWLAAVNYSSLFGTPSSTNSIHQTRVDFSHFPILQYTSEVSGRNIDDPGYTNAFIKSLKFKRTGAPWTLLTQQEMDNDNASHEPDMYPESGIEDADSRKFFELGLFVDPKLDPNYLSGDPATTFYMAIANKRTWPMYYGENGNILDEDPTDVEHSVGSRYKYMGGVDARRFSFKIDRNKFINGSQFTHFTVTDLRTGREKLMTVADTFCRDFEPGEGTLLKISPAYSIAAGMTSETGMAYNNGHRIADIGAPTQIARKKIMVWEKNGDIEFRITNNPVPQPSFENIIDLTTDAGKIDESGICHNPSVAANGNDIVVLYSTEDESVDPHVRKVVARWGQFIDGSIDWTAIPQFPLDASVPKDNTNEPNQLVTPVVTPGVNGFLCAWSNADDPINNLGGHQIQATYIQLTEDLPIVIEAPYSTSINDVNGISSIFPTLASRDETDAIDQTSLPVTKERFHLAWESVLASGESHIYYTRFERNLLTDPSQASSWTTMLPIERVSKFISGCKHHHPNIAVQNLKRLDNQLGPVKALSEPIVTWEREGDIVNNDALQKQMSLPPYPNPYIPKGSSIIVRERFQGGLGWGPATGIPPLHNNLPLPVVKTGVYSYSTQNIFHSIFQTAGLKYAITYQDSINKQVRVSLSNITNIIPPFGFLNFRVAWSHWKTPELGVYPNLSLNYESTPLTSANTLTFRGVSTFYDEDNNRMYHARVTAPLLDQILSEIKPKVNAVNINILKKETCKGPFNIMVSSPNLRPGLWCTGCPDTIYIFTGNGIPIWWNNYDITDTRPGYYNESDTTIYHWPRTEDSIRTEDFQYSLGDTLGFDRLFFMGDTALVKQLINDSTLSNINYSVLLKDSATGQTIATLDQITIDTASIDIAVKRFGEDNITSVSAFLPPMPSPTSFYVPQGPGRKVQWIANVPAPSGKAYITIHVTKDEDMPVVMSQEHGEYDNFDVIIPMMDTVAFKQAGQQPASQSVPTTPVTLTINPNPFEGSTRVTVETVKDVPLSVQVYNVLGGLIADLYNDMSKQTHYEFTLDSKTIRPGTYFIRAQAGNGIVTKKVQFIK